MITYETLERDVLDYETKKNAPGVSYELGTLKDVPVPEYFEPLLSAYEKATEYEYPQASYDFVLALAAASKDLTYGAGSFFTGEYFNHLAETHHLNELRRAYLFAELDRDIGDLSVAITNLYSALEEIAREVIRHRRSDRNLYRNQAEDYHLASETAKTTLAMAAAGALYRGNPITPSDSPTNAWLVTSAYAYALAVELHLAGPDYASALVTQLSAYPDLAVRFTRANSRPTLPAWAREIVYAFAKTIS